MKKKDYKEPTMRIVEVKQQCLLQDVSNPNSAKRSGYGNAIEQNWE